LLSRLSKPLGGIIISTMCRKSRARVRASSKKRQMSGDLESHYGAVRIKSVAGALEHHRNRDTSSCQATKSSKQKRSVLAGIGGRSQKGKGRIIK